MPRKGAIAEKDAEDIVGTLKQVYPNMLGADLVSRLTGTGEDVNNQSDFEAKRSKSIVELFEEFIDFVGNDPFDEEEKVYMKEVIKAIEEGQDEA